MFPANSQRSLPPKKSPFVRPQLSHLRREATEAKRGQQFLFPGDEGWCWGLCPEKAGGLGGPPCPEQEVEMIMMLTSPRCGGRTYIKGSHTQMLVMITPAEAGEYLFCGWEETVYLSDALTQFGITMIFSCEPFWGQT